MNVGHQAQTAPNGLWKDTMTFFVFTPTEKEFKSYHVANHIKGLLLRFP